MKFIAYSIISLLLVACSTTPLPETYLLRSDVTAGSNGQLTPAGVTLVSVDVATYIDQAGLVMETEPGQIRAAKHNLWAEPLRHSLLGFLSHEMSAALGKQVHAGLHGAGKDDVRVLVEIDQLHGDADGDAVVIARWTVIREAEPAESTYQFAQKEPLEGDGYSALVKAEKELLSMLAQAITNSL